METVETVIIGAGVVGLACARALAQSGREVVIIEAEDRIGSVTSARNSEVIHAGIYYPTGSLKAELCVRGREELYDYCAERGIGHRKCGKLIVATSAEEIPAIEEIAKTAWANGVDDLVAISAADARAMEPALSCEAALWSPSTGIIDSHGLMLSYLGEAEDHGAMLALGTPVTKVTPSAKGFEIETGGAEPMRLAARELVISAGHGTIPLCDFLDDTPPQYFARGCYFKLDGAAPFSRLIYPAPQSGGLGIHLTLDLAGQAKFGPDVEWIEGEDYSLDPTRGDGFYDAVRRYWPDLKDGSLHADYTGIRPKIAGPGEPAGDFRIDNPAAGLITLYGIESPGLTASLAIATQVLERLAEA
ncbi:MAG: NAD(P)/FAD-dependent oxidoreductase [Pseudomonadota bacterium]